MKINYIDGPQGCGKTTHLGVIANKAQRKGLTVVRASLDGSGINGLQADLRRITPKTVVLVDEGGSMTGSYAGKVLPYEGLQLPHGVQVFVARQTTTRNTWANLS